MVIPYNALHTWFQDGGISMLSCEDGLDVRQEAWIASTTMILIEFWLKNSVIQKLKKETLDNLNYLFLHRTHVDGSF